MIFNRDTFISYVKRMSDGNSDTVYNENTVGKDFSVFTNVYKNDPESKDLEESFSGILSELELLKSNGKGKDLQFFIENTERDSLPAFVLLFSILDNPDYGSSISLNSLEFDWNSPGSIFALNRLGILNKITDLVDDFKDITFTDQAGIKELQFKKKADAYSILNKYYGK